MNEYRLNSKDALFTNSSNGKLMKWTINDKFIKTSTIDQTVLSKTPKFMYEAYAEVLVHNIAKCINIDTLEYKLCRVIIDDKYDTIACESKLFTNSDLAFCSIYKMLELGWIKQWDFGYEAYKNLVDKIPFIRLYLDQFIMLDYLVLNDDRHLGNFGVLVDNIGNQYKMPIFDNGNALLSSKNIEGLDKYTEDILIDMQMTQELMGFSVSEYVSYKFWDKTVEERQDYVK